MRPIIALFLAAIACAADFDDLAAQRHREAVAKQEAAVAEQRAAAEREKVVAPQPAQWIVPKGTASKQVPAWAQGDWKKEGGSWVIGVKTIGVDGQQPFLVSAVILGNDWCCITLSSTARVVIRKTSIGIEVGGVVSPVGLPDMVETWSTMDPAKQ